MAGCTRWRCETVPWRVLRCRSALGRDSDEQCTCRSRRHPGLSHRALDDHHHHDISGEYPSTAPRTGSLGEGIHASPSDKSGSRQEVLHDSPATQSRAPGLCGCRRIGSPSESECPRSRKLDAISRRPEGVDTKSGRTCRPSRNSRRRIGPLLGPGRKHSNEQRHCRRRFPGGPLWTRTTGSGISGSRHHQLSLPKTSDRFLERKSQPAQGHSCELGHSAVDHAAALVRSNARIWATRGQTLSLDPTVSVHRDGVGDRQP